MRWQHPKHDEERTVKMFLWLPLRIKGETRWLEHTFVKQRFYADIEYSTWLDVEFIENVH